MSIEAIKQMVHELEYVIDCINNDEIPFDGDDFHEALRLGRQAIKEADKQEPVAWVQDVEFEQLPEFAFSWVKTRLHDKPLYTHPLKREWVGLTKQEIADIANSCRWSNTYHANFAHSIEAKLREKNGC